MQVELENLRQKIEKGLAVFLKTSSQYPHLWDVMRYSVLAPGKRIRPIIMLEVAKILGKNSEDILLSVYGVEYIHTASLMLDDLPCMDDAKLRRYQPANHLVYGQANTILASIALILQGLSMIQNNAQICQLNAEKMATMMTFVYRRLGLEGMILGQSLDLLNVSNLQNITNDYAKINDYKTTSLFEVSVWIAGNLCGADFPTLEKLLDYIRNLARAFQFADDLQDPVADVVGKSSYRDTGKATYIHIYGKESTQAEIYKYVENAKQSLVGLQHTEILLWLAENILSRCSAEYVRP